MLRLGPPCGAQADSGRSLIRPLPGAYHDRKKTKPSDSALGLARIGVEQCGMDGAQPTERLVQTRGTKGPSCGERGLRRTASFAESPIFPAS
jgi:hypothetical protein